MQGMVYNKGKVRSFPKIIYRFILIQFALNRMHAEGYTINIPNKELKSLKIYVASICTDKLFPQIYLYDFSDFTFFAVIESYDLQCWFLHRSFTTISVSICSWSIFLRPSFVR